jgi:hypothetical protein
MRKNSAAWREARRKLRYVRDFHFSEYVFKSYPSLRTIEPENGWYTSNPYRGRRFDERKWRIVEGGWNHEHCNLCTEAIDEGDTYWANRRRVHVLCSSCFKLFRDKIERKARTSASNTTARKPRRG